MEIFTSYQIRVSIVVSIPACHAGDRGSIPRHGELFRLRSCTTKDWHGTELSRDACSAKIFSCAYPCLRVITTGELSKKEQVYISSQNVTEIWDFSSIFFSKINLIKDVGFSPEL